MRKLNLLSLLSNRIRSNVRPHELARMIERLDPKDRISVLKKISDENLVKIIPELSSVTKAIIFTSLPLPKLLKIFQMLPPDERVDVLQALPAKERIKIIKNLEDEVKRETLSLLKYSPITAGGLMTTHFVSFPMTAQVKDVIKSIRKRKIKHYIYHVYVVDEYGKLVGVVSLRELIFAKPTQKLKDIMERDIVKVLPTTPEIEVVRLIKDNNLIALPVVDKKGKLLGIITADDAMEAMEFESSKEIQVLAGISPLEDVIGSKIFSLAKARIPALVLGLFGTIIMSYIVGFFEPTLQKYLPLAFFMPLLVYLSDAMGTQSESITIRSLALDPQLPLAKYLTKQIKSGIIVSGLIAFLCFLFAFFVWGEKIGKIVGISLFLSMNFSNLMSSLLPVIYKKVLKVDPAGISGPIDTIISDISTLVVYFVIATLLI